MEKIVYSCVLKNKGRKCESYYLRIRQEGFREKLVPLHTRDDRTARKELERARRPYEEAVDLEEQGKEVPAELMARIVRVDGPAVIAQKGPARPVLILEKVLDGYEAKLRLEGLRERTIDVYMRALKDMLDVKMEIAGFSGETAKRALENKGNLKAATRRFYSNALRSLCRYLTKEMGFPAGMESEVPTVRDAGAGDKPVWDRFQMEEIIMAVSCRSAATTEQYRQFFRVMKAIGSRDAETAGLTWEDLKDGVITFRGSVTKNRKTRACPIPTELWSELEERRGLPHQKIFPYIGKTQSSRYSVLQRALKKLGLKGGLHCWRKSVSELLYRKSGNDIRAVAQLLGHSPQTALRNYTRVRSVDELRKLVED